MSEQKEYFGGKAPKPLPWNPLPYMQEYLDDLAVNGRTTGEPVTEGYSRMVRVGLSRFAAFAAGEGVKHPGEITRAHILRYQAHLMAETTSKGEPLKVAYRQQLLTYVRGWIYWMVDVQHIDKNPWIGIKVGRTPKKAKPLEDDEIAQLFATHKQQAFTISPFLFHRREVVLALLYGWGLRIHELQSLNVSQMDMRLDWVEVRNKGGGSKSLPYADTLKQSVQRYLVHRATHAEVGEDALLIQQSGARLSISSIRKIVTELGDRAGVPINPHRLRDTFGTTMLDNDVQVERIMKMMGHTNRAQTMAYARVNDHKVKESHDAVMNPALNRLLGGSS
jgi:site-specific recombinase XerD